MSFQKITIVGNLGVDPELRFTPGGQAVTNFSIATNRSYKKQDGEQVKETLWFRVSCWGKLAEIANQYLKQGSQVMIEGRLKADPATGGPKMFTGQDGKTRSNFEVDAAQIVFLNLGGDGPREPSTKGEDDPPF